MFVLQHALLAKMRLLVLENKDVLLQMDNVLEYHQTQLVVTMIVLLVVIARVVMD